MIVFNLIKKPVSSITKICRISILKVIEAAIQNFNENYIFSSGGGRTGQVEHVSPIRIVLFTVALVS